MNITEALIVKMEKDGLVFEDRDKAFKSIDKAINEGTFEIVNINNKNVGFFSWEISENNEIFINNLFVEKQYRGTFNLRWGIRYLRSRYQGMGAFTWKNRKKNKTVRFKERLTLCCSQS